MSELTQETSETAEVAASSSLQSKREKSLDEMLLEVLTKIQKLFVEQQSLLKGDGLLTKEQLAKRWQVSVTTINELRMAEAIPFVKVGSCLRFPIKAIERWEKEHTNRAS